MHDFGDATSLRRAILAREATVTEVTRAALERIQASQSELRAFRGVAAEPALARAAELDRALAAGETPGALFGVPFALKSNMCAAGFDTDCGSRLLEGYRAPYTASFVERALAAGAVAVGTTHMDEFAMGSSGENSAYAASRNPWDPARIPGGSSSGAAAAVGAGLVPFALGSDTGGSVRQPAALCGVSGFKPSYGRVSRYGLVAFGSSLDQVSPLARSARDLQRILSVLSGEDARDATSLDEPPLALAEDEPPLDVAELEGLRIGVPEEFFPPELDLDVGDTVRAALAGLEAHGAELVELSIPHAGLALPTYYVVATAEASSNLARFDGVRYGSRVGGDLGLSQMMAATREAGFGEEVKRRILLGTYVLSSGYYDAWYARAQRVRSLLVRDWTRAFEQVDLVLGPTSPTPAFRLGEKRDDPLSMYLSDVLTVPVSLAGLPAASVPCGFVRRETDGRPVELPIGLQIVGPPRADARVLRAARSYQALTSHHQRTPETDS